MANSIQEMEQVLNMLATNLETSITTRTIKDAKKEASNAGNEVAKVTTYDDNTISYFIIWFKINSMERRGIINYSEACDLRGKAIAKERNEKEFEELAKKGITKLTPKERAKMNQLYQELMDIETVLKSYHLIPTAEELIDTLVTRMEKADYNESSLKPVQKEKQ